MAFKTFEKGKEKLAKMEQLQKLKNNFAALQKPVLKKNATKEELWTPFYNFLFETAAALKPVFDDKNASGNALVDLLKEAGCKEKLEDRDAANLKFWAQFTHRKVSLYKEVSDKISTAIRIPSIDLEYSLNLKEIAANPNMNVYWNFFGELRKDDPQSTNTYIYYLCDNMIDNIYETSQRAVKLLQGFLKTQEKPKTSIMDYFQSKKQFGV